MLGGPASAGKEPDSWGLIAEGLFVMHVILMGPQGSGKGTQAERLGPRLHLVHTSTGDLFRAAIAAETTLGRRIKDAYDRGELIADDITNGLVEERLDEIARRRSLGEGVRGALFDGFPRNRVQAEALDTALMERHERVGAVVQLQVPAEVLITRLAGRRVCEQCGAIYHVDTNPPMRPGICDRCGGRVVQREDDTPEAIKRRLETYVEQTEPLLAYYRDRGLVLTVCANRPIEAVTDAIIEALDRKGDTEPAA